MSDLLVRTRDCEGARASCQGWLRQTPDNQPHLHRLRICYWWRMRYAIIPCMRQSRRGRRHSGRSRRLLCARTLIPTDGRRTYAASHCPEKLRMFLTHQQRPSLTTLNLDAYATSNPMRHDVSLSRRKAEHWGQDVPIRNMDNTRRPRYGSVTTPHSNATLANSLDRRMEAKLPSANSLKLREPWAWTLVWQTTLCRFAIIQPKTQDPRVEMPRRPPATWTALDGHDVALWALHRHHPIRRADTRRPNLLQEAQVHAFTPTWCHARWLPQWTAFTWTDPLARVLPCREPPKTQTNQQSKNCSTSFWPAAKLANTCLMSDSWCLKVIVIISAVSFFPGHEAGDHLLDFLDSKVNFWRQSHGNAIQASEIIYLILFLSNITV